MEVTVKKESKIVEVWLTKAERDDEAFRESLKPVYKKYQDQKYLVAEFLSGDEDLYELTRDLLLDNRWRGIAKQLPRKSR